MSEVIIKKTTPDSCPIHKSLFSLFPEDEEETKEAKLVQRFLTV